MKAPHRRLFYAMLVTDIYRVNLLFVCSRNQWRSPTAEAIYRGNPLYAVRSAGTADSARVRLNKAMLQWADVVFVMEQKHRDVICARFDTNNTIVVLDIPDEYQYMDDELVEMIRASVDAHLDSLLKNGR